MLPDVKTKVQGKQLKQKQAHDTTKKLRSLAPGDQVYIRNYSYGPKWIPAVIQDISGPLSYTVVIGSGQTMKRHVDQVRARLSDTVPSQDPERELELSVDTNEGLRFKFPVIVMYKTCFEEISTLPLVKN